jgi:hypothetical protein
LPCSPGSAADVVLAGDGADEWLAPNAAIAADLLRSFDIAGLYRLWQLFADSFHFSRRAAFRIVVVHYALRQLLPDAYYATASRVGAHHMVRQRWHTAALGASSGLPWIAPDPALRAAVTERLETSYVRTATASRPDSYLLRDTRSRLDTADKWFREEETFLVGRRAGIPIREPFWDSDLIELLVRVRPEARSAGGRTKVLVRRPLTRRFPELGFDQQRKSWLGGAFLEVLEREAGATLQAMGGFPTLAELGVVDREQARVFIDDALAGRSPRGRIGWAWSCSTAGRGRGPTADGLEGVAGEILAHVVKEERRGLCRRRAARDSGRAHARDRAPHRQWRDHSRAPPGRSGCSRKSGQPQRSRGSGCSRSAARC